MIRLPTLFSLALLLSPLAIAIAAEPPAAAKADPAKAAAPAKPTHPTLKLKTLAGPDYDLASKRGKYVVVNFWATWCAPCIKEIPELSALDAARDDVEVVGLAFEEIDTDALKAFLQKHPASYPIALVDVYAPPADFEVPRGLPMTYLIAPDGTVVTRIIGPVTRADLERAVDKHRGA